MFAVMNKKCFPSFCCPSPLIMRVGCWSWNLPQLLEGCTVHGQVANLFTEKPGASTRLFVSHDLKKGKDTLYAVFSLLVN